uniref:RNA polymerase subunit H/Rpb5 C-terminal domain-containing protein n=1 Tax=viral metagenome TaxID=1070528 RepID=A0A6C0IIK9_9ZZZZ
MASNNLILKLHKSRVNLLKQCEILGYDVSEHLDTSNLEVDKLYANNKLDMIVENGKNKMYIKYSFPTDKKNNSFTKKDLDNLKDELFEVENTLTKKDILLVVTDDEPNDSLVTRMKYLYEQEGVFIVVHHIKRLQYNVLEHALVPECKILTNEELDQLKVKYNIRDLSQLPEVSRFDPQSLAICMRPGQVCKYTRKSVSSLEHEYYRVCVN